MKKENAKEKRKTLIKFIIILILGFFGGFFGAGVVNLLMNIGAENADTVDQIKNTIFIAVPIIYAICNIVVLLVSFVHYFKTKKIATTWDGEDEDVIDRIEARLNVPLISSSMLMVFNYFFFSATCEIEAKTSFGQQYSDVLGIANFVLFLGGLAACVVIQVLTVNLEKQLNPEKRGDVLDMNFSKEWDASCDEAQKQIIREAAFQAFQATQAACIVMWLVALVGQLMFDAGVFPVACVCIIFAVLQGSYAIACVKLEVKKSV